MNGDALDMNAPKIAVLGGDRREIHIAQLLADEGHEVSLYGCKPTDGSGLQNAECAEDAVRGAQWIICPSPGLGDGNVVYAPGWPSPPVLDAELFRASDADRGGLVLGRATPTVVEAAESLGISVFEMKDDRSLAVSNATSVAEAVVGLLVESTDRLLREYDILVIGYGATGASITDYLLSARCDVTVAARSKEGRARAEQLGARSVTYDQRIGAFNTSDIIINTVPDLEAIPEAAFGELKQRHVIDIASPPGGLHHAKAQKLGLQATWARGLAGSRAPCSVGDAQLRFVKSAMAHRLASPAPTMKERP